LLDEPLSALDESLRVKTRGELRKLQRQFGMTFIQVTHNQDEAYSLSDQIVVMDHGRIDQVGTPQEIFPNPCPSLWLALPATTIFSQGTVIRPWKIPGGYLIQLEVPGIGFALSGSYAQVGTQPPAVCGPTICICRL
jgi:putative spermidine/putrescine transport system ATP-binding protein